MDGEAKALPLLPGARVQGDERVAAVLGREGIAIVERRAQSGGVRLDQHLGDAHLALEVGTLSLQRGIFVVADVVPRPAVKPALLQACHEIGNQ